MSWRARLERMVARSHELSDRMASGDLSSEDFTRLSKEYAEIAPIVEKIGEYRAAESELADLAALLSDPETDEDMRELAREEQTGLKAELPALERALQLMLLPKDEADSRGVILEIRAGTGGDEAGLFAGDLFRMYQRYAQAQGWRLEMIEESETDIGGFNQVVASVSGQGVYGRLKYESGVHRVQRVPVTESGGRVHTSAATVAVLPQAEEVDVSIDEKDLRIDTYRSQGAGGQHVNTTDSAVRITHLPTGIVVQCQDEKSQHKNRAKAMTVLMARLYEAERDRLDAERAAERKGQVGSGDRSERIRTYNFPQGRVTDHRINLTLYKLDKMMTGEAVDEVIDALILEDQTARLTAMTEDAA
ncbi:MAG: peptide chain release factor 1 [Alphaproteobacteria bacterium]|nr:peptide chain release factor 1 [Alphaproteobacteria bacterium]